jgi:hypothetical protein
MRGLARDPQARTQSAEEFAIKLASATQQETQPLVRRMTDKEPRGKAYPTTVVAFANAERIPDEATISRQPKQTAHFYKGGGPISRSLKLTGRLNWKHYSAAALILLLLVIIPLAIIVSKNMKSLSGATGQSPVNTEPTSSAEQKSSSTPDSRNPAVPEPATQTAPIPNDNPLASGTAETNKPSRSRENRNNRAGQTGTVSDTPSQPAPAPPHVAAPAPKEEKPAVAETNPDEEKKEMKKTGGFFSKIKRALGVNANINRNEKKP